MIPILFLWCYVSYVGVPWFLPWFYHVLSRQAWPPRVPRVPRASGKGQRQDAGFGSRNESKWPQTWVLVSVLLGSLKTWILLGAGWHYRYYRQPFFSWLGGHLAGAGWLQRCLTCSPCSLHHEQRGLVCMAVLKKSSDSFTLFRFNFAKVILKSSLSWQSCMAVSLHSLSTFRQRRDSRDIVFPPAPCRPGKGFPAKGMPGKGFPMHKGALPKGTGKGLASGCWMLCNLIAFGPCNQTSCSRSTGLFQYPQTSLWNSRIYVSQLWRQDHRDNQDPKHNTLACAKAVDHKDHTLARAKAVRLHTWAPVLADDNFIRLHPTFFYLVSRIPYPYVHFINMIHSSFPIPITWPTALHFPEVMVWPILVAWWHLHPWHQCNPSQHQRSGPDRFSRRTFSLWTSAQLIIDCPLQSMPCSSHISWVVHGLRCFAPGL